LLLPQRGLKNLTITFRGWQVQGRQLKKKSAKGEDHALTIDYNTTRGNFLTSIIEGLNKSEYNEGILWESVFRRFDGINHNLFQRIKSLTKEKNHLEAKTVQQNMLITQLAGYRDMLADLQAKLKQMTDSNEKLKAGITKLIPEAERSKDLEDLLEEFERSKRDVDNCMGTLQSENQRMSEAIENYEREMEGLSDLADEYKKLLQKKDVIVRKLQQAEAELETTTTSYESLQNQFNTLEAEYKRLYDETQGEPEDA